MAVAAIANRIPFSKPVKHEALTAAMAMYEPLEEEAEGDDGREG